MRFNTIVLASVVVGSAFVALGFGCSLPDPNELTSDQQATNEELRRHCEAEDDDWKDRCAAWSARRHGDDADSAPAPPPSSTADAGTVDASPPPPPPPPPPPTATPCASFTYSAWGACQANNTQTRTVVTSSPAGCSGGASPVTSQACVYVAPLDGAALYTQYCAGCHGNAKKGRSAATTQAAINNNTGGMGSLKFLTAAQLAAIAAAP